jgi:PAS domain S-box-containing protein
MELDYRTVFNLAPVGLVVSRNRNIVDCNQHVCEMFCTSRELLVGASFLVLYPSAVEYERTGARITLMNRDGNYGDNRIMKRANGETFWCHVTGKAFNPAAPHEAGIWAFEDLSSRRPVKAELTAREREVAAYLMEGLTSKEIGKALGISHRTVEVYRARLMGKYKASNTGDLVHKLLTG